MCNNESIQKTGAVPTQAHTPIAWGAGAAAAVEQGFAVFQDAKFESEKGNTYTIKMNGYLGMGGESYVYRAIDQAGNEYAAKIYVNQPFNADTQAARSQVYSKLNECQLNPAVDHLMPLCDYGITEIQTDGLHCSSYFVDILPLIEGTYSSLDTLGALSPNDMYEIYLPQLVIAIRTLHEKRLVHRDIKPENIIVMGENANGKPIIALGDFGTAVLPPENESANEPIRTILGRGTPGYTPSELAMRAVLPASDMYSLGCTIGALLNGRYFFPDIQRDGFSIHQRLRECIKEEAWPTQEMRALTARGHGSQALKDKLLHLFLGLIQTEATDRFTLEDVSNFCEQGERWEPPVNREHDRQNIHEIDIRILARDCHSREDIARVLAMQENLRNTKRMLEDGSLSARVRNEYPVVADTLDTLREQLPNNRGIRTADDEDVARIIHIFEPGVHICISGKRFENLQCLCNDAIDNPSDTKEIIFKLLNKKHFSWKYGELSKQENDETALEEYRKVLEKMRQIETLFSHTHANAKQVAYYLFLYVGANIDKLKAAHMIDEAYISPESFEWKNFVLQEVHKKAKTCRTIITLREMMPEKLAWLAYNGLSVEGIQSFFDQTDMANMITVFFKLLEKKIPELTRSIYLYYGPYSFLTWIKQNIGLYYFPQKFDGLRQQWHNTQLNKKMSIDEMTTCFTETLLVMYENLKNNFSNNLLAAYCGLVFSDTVDPITSNHSEAFFTEKFMGFEVPNGFMMSLNEGFDRKV